MNKESKPSLLARVDVPEQMGKRRKEDPQPLAPLREADEPPRLRSILLAVALTGLAVALVARLFAALSAL